MGIAGVDILILVNTGTEEMPTWTPVGGQRGAKLKEEVDTVETSNKASGTAKTFEYGMTSWSITCDGAYVPDDAAYALLRAALRNRQKVKVQVTEYGTAVREGMALVKSNELDAPYDNSATYSIELQGDGELEEIDG